MTPKELTAEVERLRAEVEALRQSDPAAELQRANERLRREIVQHEEAEARLRRIEWNLTQAQRIAHLGSWVWNLETNETEGTEELYRILGAELDEPATGAAFLRLVHPQDLHRLRVWALQIVKTGTASPLEYRIVRPSDGEARHVVMESWAQLGTTSHKPEAIYGTVYDVTEQKRAEAALRQSEKRYQRIVEDQSAFIVRWRPDGTRTFVNQSYCTYFGIPEDQAVGVSFFPLISEEDREAVRERLAAISPETPVVVGEHRVRRPDGSTGWNQWVDRGFFDESGRLVELQSVGRDITEQKEAQEALRTSEEKFAKTFQASPDSIALAEIEDGRLIEVNDSFERLTGYTRDEAIGRTTTELGLFTKEKRDRMVEMLLREGRVRNLETQFVMKSGVISCLLSADTVEFGGKKHVVSIVKDISDMKRAEDARRRSEQALADLIGNLPGIAFRRHVDPFGPIFYVSDNVFEQTGYEARGLVDHDDVCFATFVHPDEQVALFEEIRTSLDRDGVYQVTYRYLNRAGEVRWAWELGRGERSEQGELVAIGGYMVDVTDKQLFEARVRHQEKMVAVGSLAAGVAHEILNPLNSLSAVAQTLRRKVDDPFVVGKVDLLAQQIDRISAIVQQMVELARPPRRQWQRCRLEDLLDAVTTILRYDKRAAGVEIRSQIDADAPDSFVMERELSQVLLNVGLNALDALSASARPDAKTLTITAQAAGPEAAWSIAFADNGPGISEESLEKVFEPFFTTKPTGLGLGLALSRNIVEEHGGKMQVDSRIGSGTRFEIRIPIRSRPPEDA